MGNPSLRLSEVLASLSLKIIFIYKANSVDPDEMPQFYCFPMSLVYKGLMVFVYVWISKDVQADLIVS